MQVKKIIPLSILTFFLATPVFAAEETYNLPTIVVTGEKVLSENQERGYIEPVYSKLALPESVSGETVFTALEIEKIHPKTVFDILELTPTVMRSFSNSMSPNNIKSRGGETIGLIVDGVYIPSTQSTRMLANFPVTIIDNIRIVRDSTALSLGPLATISSSTTKPNAAVEGYIIITTKKAEKEAKAYKFAYDSAKTIQAAYSFGDVKGEYSYTFSMNHMNTPAWGEKNNAKKSDSIYFRGAYNKEKIAANVSLYNDWGSWGCDRLEDKGKLGEAIWKFDPSNTMIFSAGVSNHWNANNVTTLSFGYSKVSSTLLEDYTDRSLSKLMHGKYAPMSWDLSEQIRDYNMGHTILSDKNTFKIGMQALYWDMKDMQGYKYRNKKEEGFGYYISDEYKITPRFSVDAGIRLDKRHTIAQNDSKFNNTWAEDNITVAAGAAYKFNSKYKITSRFSYSKQPAYDWLLKFYPSKEFEPDARKKYEVGISSNFDKAFNLDLSLFHYDISNYKYVAKQQSNILTGETDYYYNSADLTQGGLEITLKGVINEHLTYNATYSYLDVSDSSVSKTLPKSSTILMLDYKNKDYSYNLTTKRLDSYSQTATNGEGLGDYLRVDASISKILKNNSKITFYGKNLGNKRYKEAYQNGAASGMLGYIYNRGIVIGLEFGRSF